MSKYFKITDIDSKDTMSDIRTLKTLKVDFLSYKEDMNRDFLKKQGVTDIEIEESLLNNREALREQLESSTLFHTELFEWLKMVEDKEYSEKPSVSIAKL